MRPLRFSILLAGSAVLLSAAPSTAQQLCKPGLTLTETRISEARDLQRTWSAVLAADASRCASTSGQFEIEFTRLKESAPDLQFIERFKWASGKTKISLDIWWDEWVQNYRLGRIASCPCRDQANERRDSSPPASKLDR
jgi:hypothetical protein